MKGSFEETLRELRVRFVRGSGERLARVQSAIDRLAADPADREALEDLRREFHGFSGVGTTYGFPQVTAAGLEGEAHCDRIFASHAAPTPSDRVAWRSLCSRLRAELDRADASENAEPATPAAPGERAPVVLVVDPDDRQQAAFGRFAEREGLVLLSASTRLDALASLASRMPDALLVALGLPDGPGTELVEHVRSLPGCESLPILIVSGLGGFLDRVEAIHCGADGFVEKPIDWESLARRLHQLLARSRHETARILSVEDDPDQAAYVRTVLESAGYEVRSLADPKEFGSALIAFRPDLVLMDILLPGVSGYDLARYLRQDERYATLPVLFLTTEHQLAVRIAALQAGGDEHLVKPVAAGLLLSTVAARIERARFLKDLMDRDGLTRLLTHTAFLERARAAIGSSRRRGESSSALVLLDLDNFKSVNDRFGHPVGDRVLSALSGLLRRRLRQSDTIGRMGGEEFAILLEGLTEPEAVRLMDRLLEEFREIGHTSSADETFRVSFSAGVSMFEPASMDLNRWVESADSALYRAKAEGRGRVATAGVASAPVANEAVAQASRRTS